MLTTRVSDLGRLPGIRDSGYVDQKLRGLDFEVSDFWQLPGIRISVFEAQNLSGGVREGFMEEVVNQEDARVFQHRPCYGEPLHEMGWSN